MACFLVTSAAAIGVGVARHIVKHNKKKNPELVTKDRLVTSKELGALELTMWGGSFLLAGEHVLHGEITYKFPFLTAVSEGPTEALEMLQEMGTIGVAMLGILVAAWFGGVLLVRYLKKRKSKAVALENSK